MPAQLQDSSGWIRVLSTLLAEAVKGARGVLVGRGVRVGGTSEKGVLVGRGVKVGRAVNVGVTNRVGLTVQVGSSWMKVGVAVGSPLLPPPGGKKLREELGLINIIPKYSTRQPVRIRTKIESMSHMLVGAGKPRDLVCFPSKSKSSLIEYAP